MHPTIYETLARERVETLRRESAATRLTAGGRSRPTGSATGSAPAGPRRPRFRLHVLLRAVARLAGA